MIYRMGGYHSKGASEAHKCPDQPRIQKLDAEGNQSRHLGVCGGLQATSQQVVAHILIRRYDEQISF